MKLNDEQKQKLLAKLSVWKDKTCDICGENKWNINDTLFEIREFHGGKTVLGSGAIQPLITMSCVNCSNTKFLNAIKLGLIDPTNPTMEKKEGGENG